MAMKVKSVVPMDPSNFLWALKRKISSPRSAPFDLNSQQDIAEILQVVFDELKGTSVRTEDLLPNTLRATITYNSCFCSAVREKNWTLCQFPWLTMSTVPWRNFFHLSC